MDWLSIAITIATAAFLVPIFRDFQRNAPELAKRLASLEHQIASLEKSNAEEKAQESSEMAALKKEEKILSEIDKECHDLRKMIESKTKRR